VDGGKENGEAAMTGREEFDDATMAALMSAYQDKPAADELMRRSRAERKMQVRADDGRRARRTGRTKQFNCKMKPDLHKAILAAAHKAGIPITQWIERAALAYMGQGQ
jgi:hypothetical protein